jgi:hypothetical protein
MIGLSSRLETTTTIHHTRHPMDISTNNYQLWPLMDPEKMYLQLPV